MILILIVHTEYIFNFSFSSSMSADEDTIANENLNKDVILEDYSVTYFVEKCNQ